LALDLAQALEEVPLQRLEREERVQLVHSGLRALPADLREVLVLCDLQELGYEEIARTLDIPLGTVKSRINRGRLELAKRLLTRRQLATAGRTGGA
jgi:RNA polymerase sigma-70 factor (ECF subfamily)